ncbi:MAG: EamA family transporter [Coprococcus sp.]
MGGGLYLISALLNIFVLRYLDYSVVLPLTSITYVWTMIISYLILKESITKRKIAGVALILVGAVLVSIS